MTNLSSLTRRDQVLQRLKDANGGWVDGSDLSNEECGGSEGLKRLRELRQPQFGAHNIKMRQKPGSDQFQYRLEASPPIPDQKPREEYWAGVPKPDPIPVREPAETYDYQPPPIRHGTHLGRTEDGRFVTVYDGPPPEVQADEYVPPPQPVTGQVGMGVPEEAVFKFTKMPHPSEISLTTVRPCPMCKGYRRPIYEKDPKTGKKVVPAVGAKPRIVAYEDVCYDPREGHKKDPCDRCNGFGIVPA